MLVNDDRFIGVMENPDLVSQLNFAGQACVEGWPGEKAKKDMVPLLFVDPYTLGDESWWVSQASRWCGIFEAEYRRSGGMVAGGIGMCLVMRLLFGKNRVERWVLRRGVLSLPWNGKVGAGSAALTGGEEAPGPLYPVIKPVVIEALAAVLGWVLNGYDCIHIDKTFYKS